MKNETYEAIIRTMERERDAISLLLSEIDRSAFERAVDILVSSALTVTSACGSSGFAAKKFAHSLCCVECPAKFIPPSDAVHGGMGALKEGNALVVVSKGGKTEELLPLVSIAKKKGASVIAVTANRESVIAKSADVVLKLPDIDESDRYGVMSTASFAANIAIFDSLMCGLIEEKNYQLEEFALIHPGGAVGKMIN